MRYYYLQADNTPGGPEPLDALVAKVASGQITLATLVVPEGGEDWTPLARVLNWHYSDAQGQAAGPVPFSELSRMQQVHALAADAWVLPVGAQQWMALKDVLTAGGAAIAPPPLPVHGAATQPVRPGQPGRGATQPVRGATGAVRTTAAGRQGENPYASPKTQVRKVIVHHPSGGMNRLQYFLAGIGLSIVGGGLFALLSWGMFRELMDLFKPGQQLTEAQAEAMVEGYFKTHGMRAILTFAGVGLLMLVGSVIFMVKRNKNIGWPGIYVLFGFVPLVNIWYSFALMAYPPGYAHHKRWDTVTKVLLALMVSVIAIYITLFAFAVKKAGDAQREFEKGKAMTLEEISQEAARRARTTPSPQ